MPRKSARLVVLALIDSVMKLTVPQHEAMCDKGECSDEKPCIFCQINDVLMGALDTESIDDGA